MRALLLLASAALFIGYSAIATLTDGNGSFVALPMLAAAIALLVAHDRQTATN